MAMVTITNPFHYACLAADLVATKPPKTLKVKDAGSTCYVADTKAKWYWDGYNWYVM